METIKKILTSSILLPHAYYRYCKHLVRILAAVFFLLTTPIYSAQNRNLDWPDTHNNEWLANNHASATDNTINDITSIISSDTPKHLFRGLHMAIKMALNESSHFTNKTTEIYAHHAASDGSFKSTAIAHSTDSMKNIRHFTAWRQKFGSWKHTNNNSHIARLNHSTQGFFLGTNLSSSDDWYLDAIANFNRSRFKMKNLYYSMLDNYYHAGLYGGTQHGNFTLHTGATYTGYRHNNRTGLRAIFSDSENKIKSSYKVETARVFGELDYRVDIKAIQFKPFANLAYVNLYTKKQIKENNVTKLAQASSNTDIFFTTLGVHSSTTIKLAKANLIISGTAGWRYAFNNVNPLTTIRFINEGDPFTVSGIPVTRSAAVIETGLGYTLTSDIAMEITYAGQFNANLVDQTIRTNMYMRF